jgi:hypothetical protein
MVDMNKLQELVTNGVGSKVASKAPKMPREVTAATTAVKRGMGEIQKVSDNVFICVGGIAGTAVRAGLIDVAGVECMPRVKWGTTPSSKFIGQDFPSAKDSYLKLTAMMKKHAEDNKQDYVSMVTGMSLLAPLKVGADRTDAPMVAYMFADYGPHGDSRDFSTSKGNPVPRPRFHRNVFDSCFKGLATQVKGQPKYQQLGRPARVGIPRLYGAIGGVPFMQLVELVTTAAEAHPEIEFYLFASKKPDDALICPTDIHRQPKKRRTGGKPRGKPQHNRSNRKCPEGERGVKGTHGVPNGQ